MSIRRTHLVTEAQCNTLDHVLYMTTDSTNSHQFLSLLPLYVNPEPLLYLSKETEFSTDVIEVPLQGASGALHNNCASLQSNVDIFWNVDSLIAENGLHSHLEIDVSKSSDSVSRGKENAHSPRHDVAIEIQKISPLDTLNQTLTRSKDLGDLVYDTLKHFVKLRLTGDS